MNFFALLLPVLLIIGLFAALVIIRRRLFDDEPARAPIPIPDVQSLDRDARGPDPAPTREAAQATAPAPDTPPAPGPAPRAPAADEPGANGVSLTPSRPYPTPLLSPAHKTIFSRLLKALPGYVVLPRIAYDSFLEARDGTPSENTSLQNRAAQQLADFVICDKKLNVLLVCQVEDGSHLPARTQEREKLLQRAGLRLMRWNVDQPPDPAKLLNTVQTLERLNTGTAQVAGPSTY